MPLCPVSGRGLQERHPPTRPTRDFQLGGVTSASCGKGFRLIDPAYPRSEAEDSPPSRASGYTYFRYLASEMLMPRTGMFGHATRIEPVSTEHEALDQLISHFGPSAEMVLHTADGAEHKVPASLLRLVIAAAADLPY